jgi:hypothetical protein
MNSLEFRIVLKLLIAKKTNFIAININLRQLRIVHKQIWWEKSDSVVSGVKHP